MPKQMVEPIPGPVVGPYDIAFNGTGGGTGWTGHITVALDSGGSSMTDAAANAACTAFLDYLIANEPVASGTVSVIG